MALIICPKCGKKVSDKAEKCPHCGCLKDELLESAKPVEEKEIQEEQYIILPLAGYNLRFDVRYEDYIGLRSLYEPHAQTLRKSVREYYDKTANFGTIIERVPSMIESVMNEIIDISMKFLYECKIQMTPEAFIKKYYDDYKYGMDYNRIISNVVEKYADVLGEKESLERYRSMQQASRSRWQGGGFGLGGAVKGALMAGALNAGTDFVRSFGDSAQKNSDNAYIQKKIKELKNSDYAQGQIIGGAYSVIIGVFFAVLNELQEHRQVSKFEFKKEQYDKAKNICESVERYETDEQKILEGYLDAILEYPYYERVYRLIYKKVRNTNGEADLFAFLDYFGLEIEIDGITPSAYMDIEEYLAENEALGNFDYEKILPEQFYLASDIIDELKGHYEESVLRKNLRYRRLYDYVRKAATEDTLNYESKSEKQLSMDAYVPELIRKCIKTGYIGEKTFDGFLWVDGINLGCEFQDCIELYKYNKHIGKDKKYLLIYENTTMHMGKRGIGIFDEGIAFFETGKVVLFKDIVECKFNESKISLLIKTLQQNTYEFEYRFYGSKLLGFFDKDTYVGMGEFVTTGIINKIIRHYQELHRNEMNQTKSETTKAEDNTEPSGFVDKDNEYRFCVYCGKKILRETKFCNFCGKKVIE